MVAGCLFLVSSRAQGWKVTVDEYGVGTATDPSGAVLTLGSAMLPDPGPGGLPSALTYMLPFMGFPGDVLLIEPGTAQELSDVLRFNGQGTLVFYSDRWDPSEPPEPGVLADTGFPTLFQGNLLVFPEVGPETGPNGLWNYMPAAGVATQPGWDPLGVSYNFISDIPEPGSFAFVFGLGALGFAAWRRFSSRA
jgi:hypothetical protein